MINIFVGNLDYATTEEQIRHLFSPYGVFNRSASCSTVIAASLEVSPLWKWRTRTRRKMQ